MLDPSPSDIPGTVRAALLEHARAEGLVFDHLLKQYATERLLHRLAASSLGDDLVLRGGWAIACRLGVLHYRLAGADLLCGRPLGVDDAVTFIGEIGGPGEDGLYLDPSTVRGETIQEGRPFGRVRVKAFACLGKARIPIRVDVGFDDPVTPDADVLPLPSLLEQPGGEMAVYPFDSVVSEAIQTIAVREVIKVRMVDYFNAWMALQVDPLEELAAALCSTFDARRTELPLEIPPGLGEGFAASDHGRWLWQSFVEHRAPTIETDLDGIVRDLRERVAPLLERTRQPS